MRSLNMLGQDTSPDLILYNANVLTVDPAHPSAEMVAIKNGEIVWVGRNEDLNNLKADYTTIFDCQRYTLVPGLIDAHCHVFAYAASLVAVDCSPSVVRSISEIMTAIKKRAEATPQGQWIRATGYNEFYLKEKRHPNRRDIDDAAPRHPVRLNHRSSHACVLNSIALSLVGITSETADPSNGVIERDWDTGEPTGLLLEMDAYLAKTIPPLSEAEFLRGMRLANKQFVSKGITSIQDATVSNSLRQWKTLGDLKSADVLNPRITMMPGFSHFTDFIQQGLTFGCGDAKLNLGPVKIMLTKTTGTLQSSEKELKEMVLEAHEIGFPVAIHAVETAAVEAAIRAIDHAQDQYPRSDIRHRIEHCSECPPSLVRKIRSASITVVTQPTFIYYSGERYLAQVATDLQPYLYPLNSLLKSGILVAAGSDALVAPPDPVIGMYSAVTRQAANGEAISREERVLPMEALRMHTINGAHAVSQGKTRGSIEVGKLADLVLLDGDPTKLRPEMLKEIKVILTVIGGQVVYSR